MIVGLSRGRELKSHAREGRDEELDVGLSRGRELKYIMENNLENMEMSASHEVVS